jgi:hypothetical protein
MKSQTARAIDTVPKSAWPCQFGNYLRVTEGYLRMARSGELEGITATSTPGVMR